MNPLIRKLENFGPLPAEDRRLLQQVCEPVRVVGARTDIVREGESPGDVCLIVSGFACRYKTLADGRRHIMAYLIPGDFCDLHVFILREMDHTIATLSECRVTDIPRGQVSALTERPAIARALWWATLVDEATLREWLVNIGGRPAEERVAHLICELLLRLEAVGLVNGNSYELPVTQSDLAQTMGLSVIHVNRVLQRLRANGLMTLSSRRVVIQDTEKLKKFSGFNANYLHLGANRCAIGPG